MSKRIIFKNAEGGVSVLIPAPNCPLTLEEIAAKDTPAGVEYDIVDVAAVPSDRTFRGAWRKGAGSVTTDLPAAKEIAHTCRRVKRGEEYKVFDGDNEYVSVTPAAQVQRDKIKLKYDKMQIDLDLALDVDALKKQMVVDGLV